LTVAFTEEVMCT